LIKNNIYFRASLLSFLLVFTNAIYGQLKAGFTLNQSESCDFIVPIITNTSIPGSSPIRFYVWDLAGTVLTFDNPTPPTRQFFKQGINTICLTVIDAENKTDNFCKNIVIYSLPIIDITSNISSGCAPLQVEYSTNGFSPNGEIKQITWDIGGSTNIINTTPNIQKVTTTYNSPGPQTITVRVVDEKNCTATKTYDKIVNVITPKEVIPSITYLNTCEYPWTVVIKNTNEEIGARYEWTLSNGVTFFKAQPDTLQFDSEGVFDLTVKATIDDCSKTFTFKNFINTQKERALKIALDTICIGDTIHLSSSQILNTDQVSWYFNDSLISKSIEFKFLPQKSGCNKISLVRNRSNCIDTLIEPCFFVKEKPEVRYEIEGQNTCLLPADVTIRGNGEGKWKWTSGATVVDSTSGKFTFNQFGDYLIKLTISGENDCILQDSFPVKIKKFEVELPRNGPEGCAPKTFLLQDSINTDLPIINYQWTIYTADTLYFNEKSPNFTIADTGKYDIRLMVENSIGCIDTVEKSHYLGVGLKPIVEFDVTPKIDCSKTPRKFDDLSSSYANYWFWEFGDEGTSLHQNPEYKYNDTGYFDVKLTVGHNGCYASHEIDSFVYIKAPVVYWRPVINCDDPLNVSFRTTEILSDKTYWIIDYLGIKPNDTINSKNIDALRFPDFGKYVVGVYAENFSTGCLNDHIDTLFLTNPIAFYELDKFRSCIPLTTNLIIKGSDIDTVEIFWQGSAITDTVLTMKEAGVYETPILVGKDRYGCPDTFQIDSVLLANQIIASIEAPNAVCLPDSFNVKNISVSLLGIISEQKWNFENKEYNSDSITLGFSSVGPQLVTLNVKDNFGCEAEITKSIIGIDLQPKIIKDSLGCTTGTLRIAAEGLTSFTKNIDWSLGDGVEVKNRPNLMYGYTNEGEYEICLTMFDERGCNKSLCDSVTIIDPKADFEGDSLVANCPPLLTNFTNKSKNASQYLWNFGDNSTSDITSPSHIYNSVDSFDVSLIAYNSPTCSDTLVIKDYVIVRGPQASIYPEFLSNCSPLVVKVNIESDKPYFYIWDNDLGDVETPTYTSTKDSRTYTYDKPGKYKPRAIVTNDEGCSLLFQSQEFEVNEIKSDFKLEDFPLCESIVKPKIQNNTSSTASNLNFIWILEKEGFSAVRFDSIPNFTLRDRGFYNLTLISEGENCIDTLSKKEAIYVGNKPIPDFKVPNLLCEDLSFKAIQNTDTLLQGNLNFTWKNYKNIIVGSLDSINVTIDTSGDLPLTLIVKNEANCIDSITKSVNVNQGLSVHLPSDTIVCIDEPVHITTSIVGNNILSYTLNNSIGTVCTNCVEFQTVPEKDDYYFISALTKDGCEYRDTMYIAVAPVKAPEFELIHPDKICKDSLATLSLSTFQNDWIAIWQNSMGDTLCRGDCPTINYALKAGEQLKVTVKNVRFLCSNSQNSTVEIESSIPDFLVDQKTVCLGDSVTLKAENGETFFWSVAGHKICPNCPEIKFLPKGPTLASLSLVSDAGCSYTDSVMVNVFDKKLIYAGPDTLVCTDAEIMLNGWGFGDVSWHSKGNLTNANTFRPLVKINEAGYYYMTTTNGDCVLTDSLYVNVMAKIELTVSDDLICPGEVAKINYTSTGNAISYTFSSKPKMEKMINDTLHLTPETTVMIIWKSSFPTCKDVFDTSMVVVKDPVNYRLKDKYYEVSYNNTQQIEAVFDSSSINTYQIQWTNLPFLSCFDCPQPFLSDIQENTSLHIEVFDPSTGCMITDSVYIRLVKKCTSDGYYLPNIIKLSSLANAKFNFNAHEIEHFKLLEIFDRWGNKIFHTADVGDNWDGTYSGDPVITGVYVVKITATCPETMLDYVIYGDVTVIP
jgi:PKD repeat protein